MASGVALGPTGELWAAGGSTGARVAGEAGTGKRFGALDFARLAAQAARVAFRPVKRSRSAGVLAALCALAVASEARAGGNRPDFVLHEPAAEGIAAGIAIALNATYFIPQHEGDWGPIKLSDREEVAASWSDITGSLGGALLQLGMGYALESGYLALERSREPSVDALYEAAVEAESVMVATAATSFLKRMFGRCRPRALRMGKCGEHDSFPSGHTSSVAAFGGARLVRFVSGDFDGPSAIHAASLGIAEAGTVVTGILRVVSGAHGWDDVLVGSVVGHAAGFFVALAHPVVPVGTEKTSASSSAIGRAPVRPTFVSFAFSF